MTEAKHDDAYLYRSDDLLNTPDKDLLDAYGRKRFRLPLSGPDAGGSHTLAPVDDHGRIMVTELEDREISEELLATLRQISDAIQQLSANPGGIMASMMPGLSGIMGAVQATRKP